MQREAHFTLIVNILNLIKIQALHTLKLSLKFWIKSICLWGILIKNLLIWPSPVSFPPVHYSQLVVSYLFLMLLSLEIGLPSLVIRIRCSFIGYIFPVTGYVGSSTGYVDILCFLWDWWELYLPFLLFVVRKYLFCHENDCVLHLMKIHQMICENHKKGKKYLTSFWVS